MTGVVIAIVVIVVVAALLLGVAARNRNRRRRLQERFGPEYDRMVSQTDDRKAVESELAERERRHAELPIRKLSADARDRYARDWLAAQERFVDEPVEAVGSADSLLTALMAERGYPTEGYEQQVADLSVQHASTLESYRTAHAIGARAGEGTATTEDLRQAMVHYRSLFEELLGEEVRVDPSATDRVATDDAPAGNADEPTRLDLDRSEVDRAVAERESTGTVHSDHDRDGVDDAVEHGPRHRA
jgi:hypothetical protein